MSAKRPKPKMNRSSMASEADRDELRMKRSGAQESGYHSPTQQDIEDLRKDHATASESGVINADEGVRRESDNSPLPIDSLSGEVLEREESESPKRQSA